MSARARPLSIAIRNRQRLRRINSARLRRIICAVLHDLQIPSCDLCFHLVTATEMARINWQFLQHQGSTDVITFDFSDKPPVKPGWRGPLHGEIFICIADAVKQAREFGATWQSELARYAIHGVLHLTGHDDLNPKARRVMKREENRLLTQMRTLG
jgi:probable rRNA maturation factor